MCPDLRRITNRGIASSRTIGKSGDFVNLTRTNILTFHAAFAPGRRDSLAVGEEAAVSRMAGVVDRCASSSTPRRQQKGPRWRAASFSLESPPATAPNSCLRLTFGTPAIVHNGFLQGSQEGAPTHFLPQHMLGRIIRETQLACSG